MKIDVELGRNTKRNEWVRIDDEREEDLLTLELLGDPWSNAMGGYDPSAAPTQVSVVNMPPNQAKALAHALMLMAERAG